MFASVSLLSLSGMKSLECLYRIKELSITKEKKSAFCPQQQLGILGSDCRKLVEGRCFPEDSREVFGGPSPTPF